MKFGTKVLIDPKNFPAEIWKSRPMFRPSPHRWVYQNVTRNGDKTPKKLRYLAEIRHMITNNAP